MATPERRQSGWWGGISNLSSGLFASATKRRLAEPDRHVESLNATNAPSGAIPGNSHRDTPRPRVTFQEEPPSSPLESPVKRATAAQLSSRKIIDRPQGPSSKLTTNTVRQTNFSAAAATPRPLFRSSFASDSKFAFSPRATPNPLRDTFRPGATPSRDFRASTAEVNGRGMAKSTINDLFPMKIPEPPAHLSGEELSKKVPKDQNRQGSVYADEFLADLCPKDFTEAQRKQFFCILDLRRLKYASDEIYLKKDWRINILNFAKEYEKSRSLIMLRYGLYEFKSIKPSQEVVSKWKASNGIPDSEDEPAKAATDVPRPNGTEGILARPSTKRKATDDLPKLQDRTPAPQSKRARPVEREPLTETTTPVLNKGSKKRMADDTEDMTKNPPSKIQRPAASATKKFFEQVANSKPANPVTDSPSVQISVEPPSATKPKANTFSSILSTAATNGAASKSVLDKPRGNNLAATPNIFGHLSDTGSAQASGNENDAEDEDDSEEESEVQEASQSEGASVAASGGVATPQPVGGLFASKKPSGGFASSTTSSDNGEAAPTGPSLFSRVTMGQDGKPKRLLPQDEAIGSSVPSLAASESERAPSPEKQQSGLNKTWTPDTPIKFASSQPGSVFTASAPNPDASTLASTSSTTPAAPKLFDFSKPAPAASAPAFGLNASTPGTTSNLFGSSANESTIAPMFGLGNKDEFKTGAEPASTSTSNPFAFQSKSETLGFGTAAVGNKKQADSKSALTPSPLFGSAPASIQASQASPLFGSAGTSTSAATPSTTSQTKPPAFGLQKSSEPKPASGSIEGTGLDSSASKPQFGAASSHPTPTFGLAPGQKPTLGFMGSHDSVKPLFGAAPPGQDSAPLKPLFGGDSTRSAPTFGLPPGQKPTLGFMSAQDTSKPLFGAAAPSQEAPQPKAQFGSGTVTETPTEAKPLFSSEPNKDSAQSKPLFGAEPSKDSAQTKQLFGSAASQGLPQFQPSFGLGSTPATPAPVTFNSGLFKPTTTDSDAAKSAPASEPPKPLFGQSTTAPSGANGSSAFQTTPAANPAQAAPAFGSGPNSFAGQNDVSKSQSNSFESSTTTSKSIFNFGSGQTSTPAAPAAGSSIATSKPLFNFGSGPTSNPAAPAPAPSPTGSSIFGSAASGSFNFSTGVDGNLKFNNPFATGNGGDSSTGSALNFNFTSGQPASGTTSSMFNFSGGSGAPPAFSFADASQTNGALASGQQTSASAPSMFASLAPPMTGTSSGTNTPFTFGGASSLATTPANGTPEPGATDPGDEDGHKADGDEEPQAQINLTEGGPGEEDEYVVHEVRSKALKLSTQKDTSDEDSTPGPAGAKQKPLSPWAVMGVGPFRLLKHKTTGAVRMLLRGEPRGNIVLNKMLLPDFTYKPHQGDKYVRLTVASDDGKGLEMWMIQVKDEQKGRALAAALEENKKANAIKE